MGNNRLWKLKLLPFVVFLHLPIIAADNSWQEGIYFGNYTLNHFKEDMSGAINNPITTNAEMSTVDESKNGNASLICSEDNSREYISITYSEASDITIQIQMDKNLDGTKETYWSFSGISGICSNGAIRCDLGTWNNCEYYKWIYNGTTLSLVETVAAALGGCYCINSSCGSPALAQKQTILNDIAGAIAPMVSNTSDYVITKTQNTGEAVYYWGQDYSNCQNAGSMTTASSDGSNMQSLTDSAIVSQMNDENSAYYVLNSSTQNSYQFETDYQNNLENRVDNVKNSTTHTDGKNDYSYADQINGQTYNIDGSIQIGTSENAKFCEVEYIENSPDAFADGTNRENATADFTIRKVEIRECMDNWTKCPLNPGETIKHDCGAIDDFAEVTSVLSAVNEATKDMVCSSTN